MLYQFRVIVQIENTLRIILRYQIIFLAAFLDMIIVAHRCHEIRQYLIVGRSCKTFYDSTVKACTVLAVCTEYSCLTFCLEKRIDQESHLIGIRMDCRMDQLARDLTFPVQPTRIRVRHTLHISDQFLFIQV